MKRKHKQSIRRQVITDQTVQGELLFRALIYWFLCLTTILLMVLGWSLWSGPPRTFVQVVQDTLVVSAPVVFGSVVLLPIVLIDVLRVSNRFVGPIRQVRYVLKQLSSGEKARRVYLRQGDFWQDLAHYTNMVAEDLEQSREDREHAEQQQRDEEQSQREFASSK